MESGEWWRCQHCGRPPSPCQKRGERGASSLGGHGGEGRTPCSEVLEKAGLLGDCRLHGQPCLCSRGKRCPLGSAGPGEEQTPGRGPRAVPRPWGRPLSGLLASCLYEAEWRGESPEPLPGASSPSADRAPSLSRYEPPTERGARRKLRPAHCCVCTKLPREGLCLWFPKADRKQAFLITVSGLEYNEDNFP